MKFFLDTANLEELKKGARLSVIDGVTKAILAAKAGAHVGTVPFKVTVSLFDHPLTDKGLAQFLKDYEKPFQEVPAGR